MQKTTALHAGPLPDPHEETAAPADFSNYAGRPIAFLLRYLRTRPTAHLIILASVLGAVGCSVATQYGMKYLVDALSGNGTIWTAFAVLVGWWQGTRCCGALPVGWRTRPSCVLPAICAAICFGI